MAITTTTRFGIYRWSSDADAFTRTQMDTSHEYIEEYAGKMIRGAGAPSAVGAEYKNTIYLNTTNNKLYYYSATDGSGSWQILETAVVQNSLADAKGDMIVASANDTWAKLSVGAQGTILTVGASDTVGWATPAIQTPAGTISATISSTAPSGWLFLEGQAIANADSTYPSLWAAAPASWKASTTLNLPDWRGYYMASYKAASPLFGTLGATVAGATTIGSANLPTHTHAIDHDHPSATSSAANIAHTHSVTHDHGVAITSSSAGIAHTHSMAHDHPAVTSGASDIEHNHSVTHDHLAANTGTQSADHSHNINHGHTVGSGGGLSVSGGSHAHKVFQGDSISGLGFVRRLTSYSSGYITGADSNNDAVLDFTSNQFGMAVDYVTDTSTHSGHQHTVAVDNHSGSSGNNSVAHSHSLDLPSITVTSGGMSANASTHTHSVDVAAFSGNTTSDGGSHTHTTLVPSSTVTSAGMSANESTHTHSTDVAAFTGSSGNGGFANNPYVMPAGVINWMIKAH